MTMILNGLMKRILRDFSKLKVVFDIKTEEKRSKSLQIIKQMLNHYQNDKYQLQIQS